jgi:hypothetical protein
MYAETTADSLVQHGRDIGVRWRSVEEMMNQPYDKVTQERATIDTVMASTPVGLTDRKAIVVRLLSHMSSASGRIDANCHAVDSHFCMRVHVDETWSHSNSRQTSAPFLKTWAAHCMTRCPSPT